MEEEIRAEAIVRNLGAFARFLELAAAESGQIVNARKLSQEIGVAHTTIAGYYDILQDCLIAERIEPLIKSNTYPSGEYTASAGTRGIFLNQKV